MCESFSKGRILSRRLGDGQFTQRLMAQITGIDPGWISAFEKGRIPNPGLKTLNRIANALDCGLEIHLVPHTHFLGLNRQSEYKGHYPNPYTPSYEDEVLQSKKDVAEGRSPKF
jgi:transcriptional regulator with XRE-family HTH domain